MATRKHEESAINVGYMHFEPCANLRINMFFRPFPHFPLENRCLYIEYYRHLDTWHIVCSIHRIDADAEDIYLLAVSALSPEPFRTVLEIDGW